MIPNPFGTQTPPKGWCYTQPQTGWSMPNPVSQTLNQAAVLLIKHRLANRAMAQKHGWKLDKDSVEEEIIRFNAIRTGTPIPVGGTKKSLPQQLLNYSGAVAAGAKTIADMFGPEGPTNREQANERAKICVGCPQNTQGNWINFFVGAAATAIRKGLETVKQMDMVTDSDAELNYCKACECPLKSKVWARLNHIEAHMPEEAWDKLDPRCWMLSERGQ